MEDNDAMRVSTAAANERAEKWRREKSREHRRRRVELGRRPQTIGVRGGDERNSRSGEMRENQREEREIIERIEGERRCQMNFSKP